MSVAWRLYLVRHGVTLWNKEMRFQGQTDIPLDEEGREQARRIAARLARVSLPPSVVWSSDLGRARETAEAIAAPHKLTVHTTPLLRETHLGDWEGLTRADIEARGEGERLAGYVRDSHQNRPPGGETLESAWERMNQAVAMLRETHPDATSAVIVGHGGSLRALLCDALDAPITSMRRLWLANASLSIIEEHDGVAGRIKRVTLLNDVSHLEPAE
jgi:broad specificity phosphatase PhoE